jgi:two-component system sensor histidine kinase UhpB
MQRFETISPVRVVAILLAIIFGVELGIMLLMEEQALPRGSRVVFALLDAVLLVLIISPMLWFLVVRPLRRAVAERGELLARTFRIQEEERSRLARDLHDELGQAQTAILLAARSIAQANTLDLARSRAEEVAGMASAAIESTRRLAGGLSPGVLIDLGLAVAVERVCETIAQPGSVAIEPSIRVGARRFGAETEIAAYRVLQEALTNAVRHARASRVEVTLEADEAELRLTVADDGVGVAADALAGSGGVGLRGMRERAILLGGSFAIGPSASGGTLVTASFPLAARAANP